MALRHIEQDGLDRPVLRCIEPEAAGFGRSPVPVALNSAVEGLGRAQALELAPIRVNTVSPGVVDTPVYAGMPEERRAAMFASISRSLPVGRVGRPEDVARTVLYLMSSTFTTGGTFRIDGGRVLK